jgi:hypothetical protein
MVITLLEIQPGATSIIASVEVDTGNTIVKAVAWNKDTYKDEAVQIDLTPLLAGVDETEDFTISAEALGVETITGFWAVEFYSSEVTTPETFQEGVAINLLPYYECILDKTLEVVLQGCTTVKNVCGEKDTLLFASTILETVHNTIVFGLNEETIKILESLDCLCEVCTVCPDLGASLNQAGYSYKTVNNVVTLA